jgi:hypothetical protein
MSDSETKLGLRIRIGPSGVRALPLAAGINVGGHYKRHFLSSLSPLSFWLIANSPRRGCRRVLTPPNPALCDFWAESFFF